jgi:hypothetical protein
MAQDTDEFVVAGFGRLYVAAEGTAMPTAIDSRLDPAFYDLGYTTEDGLSFAHTPEVSEWFSWQSKSATRRELTRIDQALGFTLQQWNTRSFQLAFGGGSVEEIRAGSYVYSFPDEQSSLQTYSVVIDWQDGDKNYRLLAPAGNVTESVEVQLQRTELAVLPVSFRPLGGVGRGLRLANDDVAFAPGS